MGGQRSSSVQKEFLSLTLIWDSHTIVFFFMTLNYRLLHMLDTSKGSNLL